MYSLNLEAESPVQDKDALLISNIYGYITRISDIDEHVSRELIIRLKKERWLPRLSTQDLVYCSTDCIQLFVKGFFSQTDKKFAFNILKQN